MSCGMAQCLPSIAVVVDSGFGDAGRQQRRGDGSYSTQFWHKTSWGCWLSANQSEALKKSNMATRTQRGGKNTRSTRRKTKITEVDDKMASEDVKTGMRTTRIMKLSSMVTHPPMEVMAILTGLSRKNLEIRKRVAYRPSPKKISSSTCSRLVPSCMMPAPQPTNWHKIRSRHTTSSAEN